MIYTPSQSHRLRLHIAFRSKPNKILNLCKKETTKIKHHQFSVTLKTGMAGSVSRHLGPQNFGLRLRKQEQNACFVKARQRASSRL